LFESRGRGGSIRPTSQPRGTHPRRHRSHRLGGNADVDDLEGAAQLGARVDHLADLRVGERRRHRRAHGRSHRATRVGRQAGRDVDREDAPPGVVDRLDHSRQDALDGGVQAGAEERVDHHASAIEPAAQRFELPAGLDRGDRAAPLPEHLGRVAAHVVRAADQPDLGAEARPAEMSSHHEPIAAVVALAAADHGRSTEARPVASQQPRRPLSRSLHQGGARRAVLDRPAISAHLAARR
jgi:hypothetical protein